MRGVRAAGETVARSLARIDPPRALAREHDAALASYRDALAAIPAIGRRPGAYDDYGLRSLRASSAFARLGLRSCAKL
jgi:hypothetical protein